MLNKIIIGIMVVLLGWTIFSNFGVQEEKHSQESNSNQAVEDAGPEEGTEGHESAFEQPVGIEQGELAPDFSLNVMTGEELKLSDLRGKKVILNFWATWCPPCRAEMPDMQRFYEQAAGEDVEILAVNLTESEKSREDIAAFLDEFGITFPIPLDEESEVAATYYAYAIPTTYFIDTTGTIQGKIIGPMNYDFMVKQVAQMD